MNTHARQHRKPWYVDVRVRHELHPTETITSGHGSTGRYERFVYQLDARDLAHKLADMDALDIYRWVRARNGDIAAAVIDRTQLVPSDRHLTCCEIEWGSIGGKAHERFTIDARDLRAAPQAAGGQLGGHNPVTPNPLGGETHA